MDDSWTENPKLNSIDKEKLLILQKLTEGNIYSTPREMVSFLLSAVQSMKKQGLHFTQDETDQILGVLKEGKSPRELERINRIISLLN